VPGHARVAAAVADPHRGALGGRLREGRLDVAGAIDPHDRAVRRRRDARALDDGGDRVRMVGHRVTERERELCVGGHVERAQLAQLAGDERPRPAVVRTGHEHAGARAPHPQPAIPCRTLDVVHHDAVRRPVAERELGDAQPGRERVAGRHDRRVELGLRNHDREPLDGLRVGQIAGTVVGDELDQPPHTNVSSK
jgi:hypothetical protein